MKTLEVIRNRRKYIFSLEISQKGCILAEPISFAQPSMTMWKKVITDFQKNTFINRVA